MIEGVKVDDIMILESVNGNVLIIFFWKWKIVLKYSFIVIFDGICMLVFGFLLFVFLFFIKNILKLFKNNMIFYFLSYSNFFIFKKGG